MSAYNCCRCATFRHGCACHWFQTRIDDVFEQMILLLEMA